MKLVSFVTIILLSSFLTGIGAQPIPFSDKKWEIKAQGQMLEAYKGYNSLYLQNGIATLKDEQFQDGIIEFDMYQSPRASFSGLVFRMTDPINYEEIYLRSHQSGNPDAFQYTPVYNNDPAWQLYHDPHDAVNDGFIHWRQRGKGMGYNTTVEYSFDRWTHVKLLVKGQQAELYIDNMSIPVAFIRELGMIRKPGTVGVKSGNGAVWFANFTVTHTNEIVFKTRDTENWITTPPGTIHNWQVSQAFREEHVRSIHQVDTKWMSQLKWKPTGTELTGLLNLSRFSAVSDSANTIVAKLVVHSDKDQLKKLDIGYSDRIKVYCNGNALYSGNASFRTRDYRYLGTIGYFDAVYLPLKKGENIILIAVSETFGGWGLMAKWEDVTGVRVVD